jgi:hypothetical protein
VEIAAYEGTDLLLKHGVLRVSLNKRYFGHADGTPFYWLGGSSAFVVKTRINRGLFFV